LARFISKYRSYGTTVIHGLSPEAAYAVGEKQRKALIAEFQWVGRGASPWEIDTALEVFDMLGVAIGEDPSWRLSFYDTELEQQRRKWPDALRAEVEDSLRAHSAFGTDFIEVDQPRAPVPYDNYLTHRKIVGKRTVEHAVNDITAAVNLIGGNVADKVVAFENDNTDSHSARIIGAVEALGVSEPDEPLIAA
jgi:hypothetical protein